MICYELFQGWLLLSPPSSCLRLRTIFKVTLSRHLGTLTPGRVLTLSDIRLTPMPSLPASTTTVNSEFDRKPRAFAPKISNQCSTLPSASAEAYLRVVSEGTSYFRSRLVFCPYAQVIGGICSSPPVRASTSLSRGFALPTHRSTGFGYPANDYRRVHLVPLPKNANVLVSLWFRPLQA